ncbi:MAG: 50S ribosomal protein L25 [Syntrophobacterales bacterium]|jgi:large subunit ribosomal protein L25|nr:50S ribosomal protein L25 [Syntrophobacterales bacterium]
MEKIVLKATKRDVVGKKVGALRRQGKLPAVLYGHSIETTPILLDAYDGAQTLSRLTSSSLLTIDLDGKQYLAQVREKQRDFIKNRLMHVDFQIVSLTEMMHTKVGIELTGTAPAVKNFNAVIHTGLTAIEVECMPQDLPARIVVDISGLAEIGDSVRVREIVLSDKVKIMADQEEIIAIAAASKKEEVSAEAPVAEEAESEEAEGGK